ncbi:hypothetical protein [Candidatus Poriferisocius sp.]|uniref:hypothetical protein n=1 Tax=Candidatus Poriferisocius sp. TaxID=3101276 RepID=UPI003B0120A2
MNLRFTSRKSRVRGPIAGAGLITPNNHNKRRRSRTQIRRFGDRRRAAAKAIEKNIEERLDDAVRKNPTRRDLAERFRRLIDELVLDWKRKRQTLSAVKVTVRKTLDNELPDIYGSELFDQKVSAVFEHIYASYYNNGESVYSQSPP